MTLDAEKAGVPVVRGLEWTQAADGDLSRAETIIDTYRVWTHHEADGRWFWRLTGVIDGSAWTEAEAKAAAQADYEQRILSALNPDFLSALDTARAEIERLRHDNEMLTTGGIIEVAVRNPSVADYMRHWESRAEAAESALTAAQARIAELEGALEGAQAFVDQHYEPGIDSDHDLKHRIDATLSPAVKEPK